jgi:hypothetical protein
VYVWHILKTCKNNVLNIQSKLKDFDTCVACGLNFGAEIWGFHVEKDIEKVHTHFCSMILKVKNSTSYFMTCAELGRIPLVMNRKLRILKYWVKMFSTCTYLYYYIKIMGSKLWPLMPPNRERCTSRI